MSLKDLEVELMLEIHTMCIHRKNYKLIPSAASPQHSQVLHGIFIEPQLPIADTHERL